MSWMTQHATSPFLDQPNCATAALVTTLCDPERQMSCWALQHAGLAAQMPFEPLTLQATQYEQGASCAACRPQHTHALAATQVGLISPFACLAIAQAIDSVACDASLRQDALCSLRADGLQGCQGIALNLQAQRQAVCWKHLLAYACNSFGAEMP